MIIPAAQIVAGAFVFLTGLSAANAANHSQIDCQAVRQYVQQYGIRKSIRWARDNGYSWLEIAAARKCLKG